MILDPFTVNPEQSISDLFELMKKYKISGFPVVDKDKKLVGIITNRDLRFITDTSQKVKDVMTSKNLVTASEGTNFEKRQGDSEESSSREASCCQCHWSSQRSNHY